MNRRSLRNQVLARDKVCRVCGIDAELTIHHIRPRSVGGKNKVYNLVLLCRSCHDSIENPVLHFAQFIVGFCIWGKTVMLLRRGERSPARASGPAGGVRGLYVSSVWLYTVSRVGYVIQFVARSGPYLDK